MPHKYHLRQLVRLTRGFSDNRASASGPYEVLRLTPADQTGEFSYRITCPALASAPCAKARSQPGLRTLECRRNVLPRFAGL